MTYHLNRLPGFSAKANLDAIKITDLIQACLLPLLVLSFFGILD